jgi:hypothetical protein
MSEKQFTYIQITGVPVRVKVALTRIAKEKKGINVSAFLKLKIAEILKAENVSLSDTEKAAISIEVK